MTHIGILLPTFNGQAHLQEQIDSIRRQSVSNWSLFIRDDLSSDNTVDIIRNASKADHRIHIVDNNNEKLGVTKSFSFLTKEALKHQHITHFAYCDQDDIWKPNKLANCLSCMQDVPAEKEQTPVLVYSDLTVVDEDLNVIASSFMEHENLANPDHNIVSILIQNRVVGCTMLTNRRLAEMATPFPESARLHDWWLACVAAAFGTMRYLPESTILYRQHSGNTLGSSGFKSAFFPFTKKWLLKIKKRPQLQHATYALARSLIELQRKNDLKNPLVEDFYKCISCANPIKRLMLALKLDAKGQNWLASAIFYTLLLFFRERETSAFKRQATL